MYKIVGIRPVKYTNKEGKEVSGVDLHCLTTKKSVEGEAVEKVYVSKYAIEQNNAENLAVGDEIDILYNKYGSIAEIKIQEA